jgi:hypothetical protein
MLCASDVIIAPEIANVRLQFLEFIAVNILNKLQRDELRLDTMQRTSETV